jgi:hypothetical protein
MRCDDFEDVLAGITIQIGVVIGHVFRWWLP